MYNYIISIYNWLSGPGALAQPPLLYGARPGLLGVSRNGPPPEAPLGRLLAPSADILVPKVSKKGVKRRAKERSQTELNSGPPEKVGKSEFDTLFTVF